MTADTGAVPQINDGAKLTLREVLFPEGLVGCPGWRGFVLVDDPEGGSVSWLQSTDNEDVGFFVADPMSVVRSYRVLLGDLDRLSLKAGESDPLAVYCILQVARDAQEISANLLGPLVINWATGRGTQVVLAESGYSARYPVTGPDPATPA
jgi:flagellar assembly factor FliW